MMLTPLLATKLYIPAPRPNLVQRPRLTDQLNEGLSRKLTLISAPAGFGKSTAISSWIHQLNPQIKVAWLSLDDGENELIRFLTYFIAALQTLNSDLGKVALSGLQSPGVMKIETALTLLINEIVEFDHDLVLVLDDYHVIESKSIDSAMTYMLENLPPQMHLVVGSRSDPNWPLVRYRAQGQMIEIRAKQLRFTNHETSIYLKQVANLNLSNELVASLTKRTEGWITGLQLATLSMKDSNDVREFVSSLSGIDRYILDYLGQEVVSHQSQDVKTFLLKTAILNQMTGSLCDAITGQNNGKEMLRNLERDNLFIIPLDNEGNWYRYHHLFGDMLIRRLDQEFPGLSVELHQRASNWYLASEDYDAAFHHALDAGKEERAADILKEHWQEFFVSGELSKLKSMLDTLGSEITGNSVVLRMAYCMIYSQTGAVKLIPGHLDYLRTRVHECLDINAKQSRNLAAIPSLFEQMEAIVALANGEPGKAKEHAKKAISLIPTDSSPVDRRRLILAANFRLGQAHRDLGELELACSVLLEELEMLKQTKSYYVVSTALQVISIYQDTNRKQEAIELCEDIIRFSEANAWDELPPVGLVYLALAELQADSGNYVAGQENLDKGKNLIEKDISPEIKSRMHNLQEKFSKGTLQRQPLVEPLSSRELDVLNLIAEGLSNQEISQQLYLALSTVKGHNRNIFEKLGVKRRTEAVARAKELGIL